MDTPTSIVANVAHHFNALFTAIDTLNGIPGIQCSGELKQAIENVSREAFNVVREMQELSSVQKESLEKLSRDHQEVTDCLMAVEAQYVPTPHL
jgi:hypothetical protein